jgi:hypothetical protein
MANHVYIPDPDLLRWKRKPDRNWVGVQPADPTGSVEPGNARDPQETREKIHASRTKTNVQVDHEGTRGPGGMRFELLWS